MRNCRTVLSLSTEAAYTDKPSDIDYIDLARAKSEALAPVVQTLDSALHRINHYPADKYQGKQLRYPLDSDFSGGQRYPTFEQPGPG